MVSTATHSFDPQSCTPLIDPSAFCTKNHPQTHLHPESKCADADGRPCGKQSIGLLQRRHVQVAQIKYIGKESNSLEAVESGLIHSAQAVYTEHPDQPRDEWQTKVLPALKEIPLSRLDELSGKSRRMLIDARTGHRRPHRGNQDLLARIAQEFANTHANN